MTLHLPTTLLPVARKYTTLPLDDDLTDTRLQDWLSEYVAWDGTNLVVEGGYAPHGIYDHLDAFKAEAAEVARRYTEQSYTNLTQAASKCVKRLAELGAPAHWLSTRYYYWHLACMVQGTHKPTLHGVELGPKEGNQFPDNCDIRAYSAPEFGRYVMESIEDADG